MSIAPIPPRSGGAPGTYRLRPPRFTARFTRAPKGAFIVVRTDPLPVETDFLPDAILGAALLAMRDSMRVAFCALLGTMRN